MNCVHCNQEIKGNAHVTMTNILFHTCKCGETVALEKGKIRKLTSAENAFLCALHIT